MDHIHNHLRLASWDEKLTPTIRSSLTLAQNTLNCYYSLIDSSEVYCIAMGMFHLPFTSITDNF